MSRVLKENRKQLNCRRSRFSLMIPVILAAALTFFLILLACKVRSNISIPVSNDVDSVSENAKSILSNTQGKIRIICFMERKNPAFGFVLRLLGALRLASRSAAGADLQLDFVDPNWDIQRSTRLAGAGIERDSVVFERQRRRIVIPLAELFPVNSDSPAGHQASYTSFRRAESVCASAIARLSLTAGKTQVFWLRGHGEAKVDNYDERYGFSDIARDLSANGYRVEQLSFSGMREIPNGNSVLVIAGAKNNFAKSELNMLQSYLQRGGRLMCLIAPGAKTGLEGLLEDWGIDVCRHLAVCKNTLSGDDLPVAVQPTHAIGRTLGNSTILLGEPACLKAILPGGGVPPFETGDLLVADRDSWGEANPTRRPRIYEPSADISGPAVVAMTAESGGRVARDVLFRPTRICVIGETDFISNGILSSRANANREFFLSALAWLAGLDIPVASTMDTPVRAFSAAKRNERMKMLLTAALYLPLSILLLYAILTLYRRIHGR